MAYQVHWVIQNHVLYISLSGDITLDDFRDSSKQIADSMDEAYKSESASIIIGIIDLQQAKLGMLMRSAISAAQDIADVIDTRVWKAKPGFVVLITVSEAAKMLTSVLIRISKQPMTTVGTMHEALMVVRYMYPELQTELEVYERNQPPAGSHL
ncbi:MAG: hypothetical protein HY862_10585 [Chloroflexi bacterium]|nr:hypothetical protein [Chloroflexota bacterium]